MSRFRNSSHWLPDIILVCRAFYENMLTPTHVTYREGAFSGMAEYCDGMVEKIKREIYPNHPNLCDCLLDRHKIIAIHILGILKNQPFIKDRHFAGETYFDTMPNEHFCVLVTQMILLAWARVGSKSARINMPDNYRDCLLLLFRKYRQSRSTITDDAAFAYALANIAYFIEKCFLVEE